MTDLIFPSALATALQLLPALAVCTAAVYLLLPGQLPVDQHRWRTGAAAAGVLALCGLGWQLLRGAPWWPAAVEPGLLSRLLLPATGLVAVLAAAWMLLAEDVEQAGRGCLVAVIAVAALLLQAGAPVPALILAAGSGSWWLLRPASGSSHRTVLSFRTTVVHEPLLACLTAGLLTLMLLTVAHRSLVFEAGPAAARLQQRVVPDRAAVRRALRREPPALSIEPAGSQFTGLFDAGWSTQPVTVGLLAAGAITLLLARSPGWSGAQRRNERPATDTEEVADADWTPREADGPEEEEGA